MRLIALFLFATFLRTAEIAMADDLNMKLDCKSNPKLADACFLVHGRLTTYNGTPSLRIWPIGSHRLLGIVEDENPLAIPDEIRSSVGFDKDIYGDYLVCPFTKRTLNAMQLVCVEKVSNYHVQKHPQ